MCCPCRSKKPSSIPLPYSTSTATTTTSTSMSSKPQISSSSSVLSSQLHRWSLLCHRCRLTPSSQSSSQSSFSTGLFSSVSSNHSPQEKEDQGHSHLYNSNSNINRLKRQITSCSLRLRQADKGICSSMQRPGRTPTIILWEVRFNLFCLFSCPDNLSLSIRNAHTQMIAPPP